MVGRVVLSLPEAEERETWGHPTFRVRDKMSATPKRLVSAYDSARPAHEPGSGG
jgi:hypothetical protein